MKLFWIGIAASLLIASSPATLAQVEQSVKIDGISYFGYKGLDLEKIKSAMELRVGDEIDPHELFVSPHKQSGFHE